MPDLTRRQLLIAGGVAATDGRARWTAPAVRTAARREIRCRAVVIGSGLAGAITAYRLARAGVDTLVLERGRRWPVTPAGDTFATTGRLDERALYLEPPDGGRTRLGVLEVVPGDGLPVVRGAGVGGSTLIYAGATVRPGEAVFRHLLPGVAWEPMEREYYPRTARRLGATPLPADLLRHPRWAAVRTFLAMGRRAGLPTELTRQTVDWDVVRQELTGRRVPSLSVGEYLFGVNSGARNSVDRTYLVRAERSGRATVAPLHRVTGLGPARGPAGRFRVEVERITPSGDVGERLAVVADAVFCAAGSVGTSQLLVAARETGALPGLNEHVGRHWGGNGDEGWFSAAVPGPTGGPQGGGISAAVRDESDPTAPVMLENVGLPVPAGSQDLPMLAMSSCPPAGDFRFDPSTRTVVPHWPAGVEPADRAGVRRHARRIVAGWDRAGADRMGDLDATLGRLSDVPGLDPVQRGVLRLLVGVPAGMVNVGNLLTFTGHPLGGAVIDAACDNHGRVRGHRGLYVTDAALIPGSTGACNPSWTIAALAERCLDTVLAEDAGPVF